MGAFLKPPALRVVHDLKTLMLPASTVPQSGQVLVSHHCRVSSMPYSLHLNMMIRQMVSRGLVYPLRVSRLTYTAPNPGECGKYQIPPDLVVKYQAIDIVEIIFSLIWQRTSSKRRVETGNRSVSY